MKLKRFVIPFALSITLLTGCGVSLEKEAYDHNKDLIAEKFPVPESLKFPKFEEKHVLCEDEMCSVMGEVEYENQYGNKVTGDYKSILTFDDDYFYLYKFELNER